MTGSCFVQSGVARPICGPHIKSEVTKFIYIYIYLNMSWGRFN
jgi:hypothetical protein